MSEQEDLQLIFLKFSSSSKGLSSKIVAEKKEKYGLNVIEENGKSVFLKIVKHFWGPIPWMIEAAAFLSLAIEQYVDFTLIATLLFLNAFLAFWQEFQAGNAISALKKKMAVTSRVLRDQKWIELPAEELVPGDIIHIRAGDIIPSDVMVFDGTYLSVDQSVLTGESLPVEKKTGDCLYSGSTAQKGEMHAIVTATGKQTYFGKTVQLVSTAKSVSHFQQAILRIGHFLIFVCLGLVATLVAFQLSHHAPVAELLKFCLILTVASIPVAMPAVLSVTMAIGALALSKMKSIVTRLESIEEMAGVDILCCDKTGTLTYNKLIMGEPLLCTGVTQDEIVALASLACRAENFDAIDQAIFENLHNHKEEILSYVQTAFLPFDPISKRTEATIESTNKKTFKVTKGAPQVILALCQIEDGLLDSINNTVTELAKKGNRAIAIAKTNDQGTWCFLGILPLYDKIRDDSYDVISQAKEFGIQVKMLTGDHLAIAREVAQQVGIGKEIFDAKDLLTKENSHLADMVEEADGFSQVFPESKYLVIQALQSKGHIVAMTGDGVNDAPALQQANLGIAVQGAVDAARASASLVLTAPGLSVIIKGIEEARRIFERMTTYTIYRITESIRIMFFMTLSMLTYQFYPVSALMLILLALLNDIPIMAIAYDNASLPPKPVRWEMPKILGISCLLGAIGVISSFLLLLFADSWLHLNIYQLQSIIFLKLSLAGHQTLFIVRSRNFFWSKPFPAPVLLIAIVATQVLAACAVGFGILLPQLPWHYIGWVWLYAWGWMFAADWVKTIIYRRFFNNKTSTQ